MSVKYRNQYIFPILITFAALVYFIGLFVDVAGDAGKYAAIAKNIFYSGDFINLTIHGDPYDQKPPLLFWLSTIGYYLFGVNNFGFKFFPVLYAFFGVFCLYKLGASLYNKRVGRITAVLISFSLIYFLYNADVHTDTVLMTNVAFALWQLYEYLKKKRVQNFVLGFFAVGLAMLSKGPIGAFVPAFAVIGYLLFRKEFRELFHPKWVLGIMIALVTTIPALWGLYNQFGMEGLKFFFWTNNFGRIDGSYVVSKNTDYFFYLHTILYIYAPWGLALFAAIFFEFNDLVKKRFRDPEYYVFGGTWLLFIILSVANGKSPNYLLILIPLLTVTLAKWLNRLLDQPDNRWFRVILGLQTTTVILLWICIMVFITYLFPVIAWYWLLVAIALFITYYTYRMEKDAFVRFFAPSMLAIALFSFFMNVHILPFIFRYQSSIVATRTFNMLAGDECKLYNYDDKQFDPYFYGKTDVTLIKDRRELKEVIQKPNSWIFCDEEGYENIRKMNAGIDTVYQFKHRGIYRTGIEFTLPSSRERSLRKTFLVKLQ